MFDKLLNQIKDEAFEIINKQSNIPDSKKSIATDDAIQSISDEIDRMMQSSDFSSLSGIKEENAAQNNPTIQNVKATFSHKLQQNIQMDKPSADSTSEAVIPALFTKMREKFSGGGLDVKSLMSSLSLSDMMKLMANMNKLKEAFGK